MRALVGIAAVALALVPSVAHAQGVEPFDGTNPFDCVLQQAGTEATFPDPEADPFCVEYDKRHQNVTELGVVQFLSLEPARVAAASPKCFYFQRDHWVGSVVQEDGRTETYSWDGSYYFDKARGAGGAYVENFTFNNQSGDPTTMPGFPEEWKPFFGYGRGGVHSAGGGVEPDPSCVAKAEEKPPYRNEPVPSPGRPGCPEPDGPVVTSIGGLRLGDTRAQTIERNGSPKYRKRGFFRYCVRGGGKYMIGFGRERAEFLLTSNPGFEANGVRRLTPKRQARRRLKGERELFRTSKTVVWRVARRDHVLLVLIREGRVAALASAAKSLSRKRVISYYRRSR
jgi:hypothetical protein